MVAATDNISTAKRFMKQAAVRWPVTGVDGYGQPSYGSPEEIDCRWEDTSVQFLNAKGDLEVSRSKLIVDRDMDLKDKLMLGDLESELGSEPDGYSGVWEVRSFSKVPNARGNKFLREVIL